MDFNAPRRIAQRSRPNPPLPPLRRQPAAPLTGAAKTLDDAEQLYGARNLEAAKKKYLEVLEQTDEKIRSTRTRITAWPASRR
jgi:hypothetical protein